MVGRFLRVYKKISQSIMFLPYFISAVVIGVFAYNFLNVQTGFINSFLKQIGHNTINFYSIPELWPFIIVLAYLWQFTGYGSIVYFAAIMGIDSEMMEASEIDGANVSAHTLHSSAVFKAHLHICCVCAWRNIKGNFGLFYNLTGSSNTALFPTTDIIETFVFRSLNVNFNFQMGSALVYASPDWVCNGKLNGIVKNRTRLFTV